MSIEIQDIDQFLTREEKMVECYRLLSPYKDYFRKKRGWGKEAMHLVEQRKLVSEKGKAYTIDQIRHVVYGNSAIVPLAQILAEIARRKQAAIKKLKPSKKAQAPKNTTHAG